MLIAAPDAEVEKDGFVQQIGSVFPQAVMFQAQRMRAV